MGKEIPNTKEGEVMGEPTTSGDTVFASLERIEVAVGTAPTPRSQSGTHTVSAVDTTYRQIAEGAVSMSKLTPTTDGKIEGRIFLTNMAASDVVSIQVQVQDIAGNWKAKNTFNYADAQPTTALVLDIEEYYYNTFGVRVMIYQSAGTARAFPFVVEVD